MSQGFIYAIKCDGRVKIGWSLKPYLRFTKIRSDAPAPCEFVGVVPGSRSEERAIHALLAEHRVHSEWFSLEGPVLTFLEQLPTKGRPPADGKRRKKLTGNALNDFLVANRIKGADFGKLVGLSQAMISRLCNGKACPSLGKAIAIQDATGGVVKPSSFIPEMAA